MYLCMHVSESWTSLFHAFALLIYIFWAYEASPNCWHPICFSLVFYCREYRDISLYVYMRGVYLGRGLGGEITHINAHVDCKQ